MRRLMTSVMSCAVLCAMTVTANADQASATLAKQEALGHRNEAIENVSIVDIHQQDAETYLAETLDYYQAFQHTWTAQEQADIEAELASAASKLDLADDCRDDVTDDMFWGHRWETNPTNEAVNGVIYSGKSQYDVADWNLAETCYVDAKTHFDYAIDGCDEWELHLFSAEDDVTAAEDIMYGPW